MKSHRIAAGVVAIAASLTSAAAAQADVTVTLRIEGPTKTLFEGPVTAGLGQFNAGGTNHTCDGTSSNGGTAKAPVVTRGNVITASKVTYTASWFDSIGSPSFSKIGDESVDFDPNTNKFLGEYKNGQFASVGSCADPVANGDDVLFAYGDGSEQLLHLSTPSSSKPGPAMFTVTDESTNKPVAGVAVGSATTDNDGHATVTLAAGAQSFKATKTGTIRSNRVDVCASTGIDGLCGYQLPAGPTPTPTPTPAPPAKDTTKPTVKPAKLKKSYAKGKGPRTLKGSAADAGGLSKVELRLISKSGKKCKSYSKTKEKFVAVKTCSKATFFSIGSKTKWSYLLPKKLGTGSYTLEVLAVDKSGNKSKVNKQAFKVK